MGCELLKDLGERHCELGIVDSEFLEFLQVNFHLSRGINTMEGSVS